MATRQTSSNTNATKLWRELEGRSIRDIMTPDPMVIDARASISNALDILGTLEIRHLPVMDGQKLVGIVSDRDLAGLWRLDEQKESEVLTQPVTRAMNTNVLTVTPDTSLKEAVDQLLENRVGALPVVDERNDELVGIVSYVDLLRFFSNRLAD